MFTRCTHATASSCCSTVQLGGAKKKCMLAPLLRRNPGQFILKMILRFDLCQCAGNDGFSSPVWLLVHTLFFYDSVLHTWTCDAVFSLLHSKRMHILVIRSSNQLLWEAYFLPWTLDHTHVVLCDFCWFPRTTWLLFISYVYTQILRSVLNDDNCPLFWMYLSVSLLTVVSYTVLALGSYMVLLA